MILGLGGLVPLPPDALVTPVTFRVRKRELRGILAEFDELEDATRELSGEWVVTKRSFYIFTVVSSPARRCAFQSYLIFVEHIRSILLIQSRHTQVSNHTSIKVH